MHKLFNNVGLQARPAPAASELLRGESAQDEEDLAELFAAPQRRLRGQVPAAEGPYRVSRGFALPSKVCCDASLRAETIFSSCPPWFGNDICTLLVLSVLR